MSKRIIFVFLMILAFALCTNTSVRAEYEGTEYIEFGSIQRLPVIDADKIPYRTKAINKLDRGVVNAATFWLEVPAEVAKVSKEQDPLMGATVGLVHGLITSVVRAGTAAFDTVTFFVPPYDKPVMKPEYALNRADDKIKDLFW